MLPAIRGWLWHSIGWPNNLRGLSLSLVLVKWEASWVRLNVCSYDSLYPFVGPFCFSILFVLFFEMVQGLSMEFSMSTYKSKLIFIHVTNIHFLKSYDPFLWNLLYPVVYCNTCTQRMFDAQHDDKVSSTKIFILNTQYFQSYNKTSFIYVQIKAYNTRYPMPEKRTCV